MANTWYFKAANGSLYTGWQTAAALGVQDLAVTWRHLGVDEVKWSIPGDGLANPLWDYDATIMLRYADASDITVGTTWFVGRVATIPRQLAGHAESVHYTARGGMAWLERITYEQTWQTMRAADNTLVNVPKPRVVLGQTDAGARCTTGATIASAIAWAISRGTPLALDASVAASGFTIPYDERDNLKVADAVIAMMRWMPDRKLVFDYATAGASDWIPTVKIIGAASSPKTVALTACHGVELSPRYDLVVPGVRIVYEKTHEVDGNAYSTIELDEAGYPDDVDAPVISFDLQGSRRTYASQKVTTADYPETGNDPAWWKLWAPWLANIDSGDLVIHDVTRSGSDYSRYLTDGALPDWLSITREEETWKGLVDYVQRDGDGNITEVATDKEISVRLVSTSASSRTYRKLMSFDAAEDTPAGVAAALLASWSVLHYSGSIGMTWGDFPVAGAAWPQPWDYGQINISGGRAEWSTMNANIQDVAVDCATGVVTYTLGPCDRLGADDRVALYQAARGRRYSWNRAARTAASAASDESEGAQGTPSSSVADGAASNTRRLVIRGNDHTIDMDPGAVHFGNYAYEADQTLKPREMPVLAIGALGALVRRTAQVIAGVPYGDSTPISDGSGGTSLPDGTAQGQIIAWIIVEDVGSWVVQDVGVLVKGDMLRWDSVNAKWSRMPGTAGQVVKYHATDGWIAAPGIPDGEANYQVPVWTITEGVGTWVPGWVRAH